ncbi:MAG TPA: hypothetical protein VK389_01855, partial [Thermoanaerobaculia bacterium]|nr:hypothetical protein [Thermoanaerobaculia bacterium]
ERAPASVGAKGYGDVVIARVGGSQAVLPGGAASPDELAAALNRLLSSAEERHRMGEAGRRRAALYDMSLVATRFLEAVGLASPPGSTDSDPPTRAITASR